MAMPTVLQELFIGADEVRQSSKTCSDCLYVYFLARRLPWSDVAGSNLGLIWAWDGTSMSCNDIVLHNR
eukprot:COSAG06_NODE_414_length_16033_cov_67.366717_17_plen_69_part_00